MFLLTPDKLIARHHRLRTGAGSQTVCVSPNKLILSIINGAFEILTKFMNVELPIRRITIACEGYQPIKTQ